LGNQQDQFEKILHKQCPMHLKSKHTLFQCISLPDQDEKGNDKEHEEGDTSRGQGYQDPKSVINVIFGGDDSFPT
jgi:hypothetical protein